MGKISNACSDNNRINILKMTTAPQLRFDLSDDMFNAIVSRIKSNIKNENCSAYEILEGINISMFNFSDEYMLRLFKELDIENDVLDKMTILIAFISNSYNVSLNVLENVFKNPLNTETSTAAFSQCFREFLRLFVNNHTPNINEKEKQKFFLDVMIPFFINSSDKLVNNESDNELEGPLFDTFESIFTYYADSISGNLEISSDFLNKYIEYMPVEFLLHNLKNIYPENKEIASERIRSGIESKICESFLLNRNELSALNIKVSVDTLTYELFNELTRN